jgi:peroxiredoxin
VCTNEHACFVNDLKQFESLDAQVLGLSVDSAWAHKAFAEKMGITYPLLADFNPRGAVADKFGVYLAEKGITGRAIAIIDKAGKIAWFKNYDIPVVPDMKEVGRLSRRSSKRKAIRARQRFAREIRSRTPRPRFSVSICRLLFLGVFCNLRM